MARALRIGLAGLATLAAACVAGPAAAIAGGDRAAAAVDAKPTKLFVQDAAGGSLLPARGARIYRLTLRGVNPRTLWFHNRPGNRQGTVSNRALLELLFGGAGPGPRNVAIDAWDPKRRRDVVMGVALLSGEWNARKRVLSYRVRELNGSGGAHAVDRRLPRHFEDAGVFVDEICTHDRCARAGEVSTRGEVITKVFVQDAASATFEPDGAHPGDYTLTLHGANPRTLWFQSPPGRLEGTVPNQRALDPFFREPGEEPPNAAIDAWDPRTRDDVTLGFKVLDGEWDAAAGVLRYRVHRLRGGEGGALPHRLRRIGLFIDDCGAGCQDLIKNLIDLGIYLNKFFGDRQTCTGIIENLTAPYPMDTPPPGNTTGTLNWQSDDYASASSWDTNPPRVVPYTDPFYHESGASGSTLAGWTTVGYWLHDCWNVVNYAGAAGTVSIYASDPYYGSNNFACTATGALTCFLDGDTLGGDHLVVEYCIMGPGGWSPAPYCRNQDEP